MFLGKLFLIGFSDNNGYKISLLFWNLYCYDIYLMCDGDILFRIILVCMYL